jgi:hypothetical protein
MVEDFSAPFNPLYPRGDSGIMGHPVYIAYPQKSVINQNFLNFVLCADCVLNISSFK